jgi:hypothetical protein
MNTWKIAYTITAGGYEYGDYLLREAEQLTAADAAALVAERWSDADDPEEAAAFRRTLIEEGYATIPGDGRLISELGWEKVSPIVVTVRNGCVEGVTGVPVDVTVEVQDWDNGETGENGEPVPTVSEWTGPC